MTNNATIAFARLERRNRNSLAHKRFRLEAGAAQNAAAPLLVPLAGSPARQWTDGGA